jgi:hypothetical protein
MIEAFEYGKTLKGFDWIGDMIDSLEAIELPSSTDLEKKAFELHKNSLLEFNSYLDGGKFVIDKIAHTK